MMPLVVLGAGGHAKVVIATARSAGFGPITVTDDDAARWGSELLGAPVVGPLQEALQRADVRAVLAVGDNRRRHALAATARCEFAAIVHPSAVIDPTVRIGAGTVVFAGCVIQPDAIVDAHCIINTGSSIDHDCALGAAVHVAPGARLAGNVTLGEGVFLGIGCVVIPGVSIGSWTRVGAGAAVTRDLPASVTAIGVPARVR